MTAASSAMISNDQNGYHGMNRKLPRRLRPARIIPIAAAQVCPRRTATPTAATTTPSTRWTQAPACQIKRVEVIGRADKDVVARDRRDAQEYVPYAGDHHHHSG